MPWIEGTVDSLLRGLFSIEFLEPLEFLVECFRRNKEGCEEFITMPIGK
jgi:hypothetical protein